jgi:transcription initiation factor TFIIIB Brf1 subunit/transcription initiation factor TFIIB
LAVPPALRQRAHDYARTATEASGFAGKPACIAAACVYLASQEIEAEWTQSTVADAADVTAYSIRSWCEDLDERVVE